MSLRYECDDPDFAGCFVEISKAWSRKQYQQYWAGVKDKSDEWFALIKSKITALRLVTVEGVEITHPDQLTDETIDEIDLRLWTWFANVIPKALFDVSALGNALGRRLWVTAEESKDTTRRPTN